MGRVPDRFQSQLVAAAGLDVQAAAALAHGERVGALINAPAVAAGDGGRHGDELQRGVSRLGSRGDKAEGLRHRRLVNRVPYATAHAYPGYRPASGALAYRFQHAFAQPEFVHGAGYISLISI